MLGETTAAPVRTRGTAAALTAIAAAALAAIWFLAAPRDVVCPAIWPAPPGCTHEAREAAGVTWSVVVAAAYAVTLALSLTVGRTRRAVRSAAVVGLVLIGLIAYGAVLPSTGFLVST